jgi:hypothetical protein
MPTKLRYAAVPVAAVSFSTPLTSRPAVVTKDHQAIAG